MKKFFLFLTVIFLVSCASSRLESRFSPVYVTNSSKFCILQPESMTGSLEGLQRIEASFGKNQLEGDVYVIANDEQLSMILMSEFGTTLAELFYDGEEVDFESALFPKKFKAEYVVADFQFALYDVEILQKKLAEIGVDFEILTEKKESELIETRKLSQKGKLIAKITKISGKNAENGGDELKSIRYENFLRGYSYELTEVSE